MNFRSSFESMVQHIDTECLLLSKSYFLQKVYDGGEKWAEGVSALEQFFVEAIVGVVYIVEEPKVEEL